VPPDDIEARLRALLDRGAVREATALAIEGYGPELLGYLAAVLGDETAASDVFSDVCEHFFLGMRRFAGRSSVRTWAYAIAWRRARRHLREPARARVRRLRTSEVSALGDSVRKSAEPWLRSSVKDAVHRLRESLPPDDRTLLVLRVDRELSWREVAQVLSRPGERLDEAAVRKRFERVKERLRALATEMGLL
jgi:RNA polymerase sigma-70 factor (ECF subfamily)